MPNIQIHCPHCCATLSFGQPLAAGANVTCLVCNRVFAVAAATVPARPSAPARPAKVRSALPVAPSPISSAVVMGGAALAGVVLLLLGGLAYVVWTNVAANRAVAEKKDTPDAPVAFAPPVVKDGGKIDAPPVVSAPKKSETDPSAKGDVDIADLPKKDRPTPVVPEPDPKSAPRDPVVPAPLPPPITVTIPPPAPVGGVPGFPPDRVNAAIDKGVAYLKSQQSKMDGSWQYSFRFGATAWAGLTLLECQVPAKDPAVQKAAQFIRMNLGQLTKTYEIACTILFLDRLGDPRDRVLIQGLAQRLLAGQTESGGWNYDCPPLGPAEAQALYLFLQSHRPVSIAPRKGKAAGDLADNPLPPQAGFLQARLGPGGGMLGSGTALKQAIPGFRLEVPNPITQRYRPDGSKTPLPAPVDARGKKLQPLPPSVLPPALQQLPIVKATLNKGWFTTETGSGDNSNTQFALLALWAARRYEVPSEYALLLDYQRFKLTRGADGGWGYQIGERSSNSMLCAGLLGLATGHGALPADKRKETTEHPIIQTALEALAVHVGTPQPKAPAPGSLPNLYFLWSVERVAMLYDLKTVGGKDWYAWGAQLLLANQADDGHWTTGSPYTGAAPLPDTCFALLFLKRSNLVADLTEHLRLQMVIRDPGAK